MTVKDRAMQAWKRFWWTFDDGRHCDECGATSYEGPRWHRLLKAVIRGGDVSFSTALGFVAGSTFMAWAVGFIRN